jgi:hypothetical protein
MAKSKAAKAIEPEIIAPQKAGQMVVRVDANYLRTVASRVRVAVVRTEVPAVLDELLWAAKSGQMEAHITVPHCGKLDPLSVAEAISEHLVTLGMAARPATEVVNDSWGREGKRLVIQVTWRTAL